MQLLFPFLNGLPSLFVAQKQDRSLNFNWGYSVGYVGGTAGIVSIFRGNKFSKKNFSVSISNNFANLQNGAPE